MANQRAVMWWGKYSIQVVVGVLNQIIHKGKEKIKLQFTKISYKLLEHAVNSKTYQKSKFL